MLNPDSKNTRAAKRYSTFAICPVKLQTFSTQQGQERTYWGVTYSSREAGADLGPPEFPIESNYQG
jgi:hypothetical protein